MATKAKHTKPKDDARRLDAEDWIGAALHELAEHGIDGVRIELLARKLGVTKGSFYWHFKDRDALYVAMIDGWRKRATQDIVEAMERDAEDGVDPRARFHAILEMPFRMYRLADRHNLALALRMWARRDKRVRVAVEEIDELRIRHLAGRLAACGVRADEVRGRAILTYAYMRVMPTLVDPGDADTVDRCEQLLLGVPPRASGKAR